MIYLDFIKNYKKSRIRLISKGSKILRKQGKERFAHQLKESLTNQKLNNVNLYAIPSLSRVDTELAVRQYLTSKILGLSFNNAILYSVASKKPFIHPIPKEWSTTLESHGVIVNKFVCSILWKVYCFYFFLQGVFLAYKKFNFSSKVLNDLGSYSYFIGLSNNFDAKCVSSNPNDHNIINWYLQWKDKSPKIRTIGHSISNLGDFQIDDINISYVEPFPKLQGFKQINFILISIFLFFYSLFLLIFNPYQALLYQEIIKSQRVRLLRKNQLAQDYLFSNSSYIYRPLWTYEAEKKGSRILLYFYSANLELTEVSKMHTLQHSWHLMSWPNYLVWDKYQANFIKKYNKRKFTMKEVGSIWFSSCDEEVEVPPDSIAVFDITPFRVSWHSSLGVSFEYYTYDLVNKFLTDIKLVLNENNIKMLHKMKRSSDLANKKYIRRVKLLSNDSSYINVNPSIDALQIIQKTRATISIPFTSTSIIAKIQNKPTAYYDPTGLMRKDLNAAHGITILSNIDELRVWVAKEYN